MSTNASSVPAICSAMATDASLPEATAMPFSKSRTDICSPGSRKIWEPPIEAACSLTCTISSSVMRPSCNASMMRSMVMIFVMDAGGSFSWAFFSYNTVPVDASMSRADTAWGANSVGAVAAAAAGNGKKNMLAPIRSGSKVLTGLKGHNLLLFLLFQKRRKLIPDNHLMNERRHNRRFA